MRTKILEMLPVFQQDVWQRLGLEHRQVSKVVLKLEKELFLTRTKDKCSFYLIITPAGKTELKKLVPEKEPVGIYAKPKSRFAPLVSNGVFSPCTGCSVIECDPCTCVPLGNWVLI
ncbi:MAG: MarR family winged helix-turn-helix transcriptional regulator [Candidatus Ratteibacteria bacterium]|nr:MarR family winged helix-turn-helix transcriptional regulator [Candidatus Ratteibacteria bacterium]